MSKRRLGKGIDALLQGRDLEQMQSVVSVSIDSLVASPHQPRKQFSEATLRELADSIREKGIIQPILAEQHGDGSYEIIAGERRFRAARLAGLQMVPVLLRSFTEEEKLEIALIENIQRQNLNPIEEAQAYRALMETAGLTQEDLATRLGMNRPTIANALRLLKLPEPIQDAVSAGEVSAGHGRVLLTVSVEGYRDRLLGLITKEGISVREAERIAADLAKGRGEAAFGSVRKPSRDATGDGKADATETEKMSVEVHEIQEKLLEILGTRVKIKGTDDRGKIQIDYLSTGDLERIYDIIAGTPPDAGT